MYIFKYVIFIYSNYIYVNYLNHHSYPKNLYAFFKIKYIIVKSIMSIIVRIKHAYFKPILQLYLLKCHLYYFLCLNC